MSFAIGLLPKGAVFPCGHFIPPFSWWENVTFASETLASECQECKRIENERKVTEYLKLLGYSLGWDFSRKEGIAWWEIKNEKGCILQMTINIDFLVMVRAIKYLHKNPKAKEIPDEATFEIRGHGKEYRALCRKVWEADQP